MIKFEQINQKQWLVAGENGHFTLDLITSSVTNKFSIITDFIEEVSKHCGKEFDEWLMTFLTKYESKVQGRFLLMMENVPTIKFFVDSYLEHLNTDYSQFVDETKAKKTSILFTPEEVEQIVRVSSYLKLYSMISNSENLKLNQKLHKKVYNEIVGNIADTEIIFKIFNIIRTKTFRYNLTDRYMWDYIKMIQGKDINDHVIEIFNFIMNSILVLCDGRNPISYFVSVVDESVKWFLRSVYKGSIIYDDSIATEDIHSQSTNNLKTYSYNDTLGRLKGIAYQQIYDTIEKPEAMKFDDPKKEPDDSLIQFQNRVSSIQHVSPLCECLVFPILSRLTNIPYIHFKTISPEHAAILSVYTQTLLKKIFRGQYKNLFSLLSYYPTAPPSITTTYKLKGIHSYINTQNEINNFYGFRTKILPHKILSHFVGRVSRVSFRNILDGQDLVGIPLSKIEEDVIKFYTLLFAGKMENEFEQMRILVNSDF